MSFYGRMPAPKSSSPVKAKGVGARRRGVGAAVANAVDNVAAARLRDEPITLDKFLDRLPDVEGHAS